jgi:putative component of membrane protein insertase Oxa1/YidC/SpoIIIJ protein YidD
MKKTILLFFGICLVTTESVFSQQTKDSTSYAVKKMEYIGQRNDSNRRGISGFFYGFYKDFISPNDLNSCSFYPSCSTFAVEAVKKKGFFSGILKASDRLQRCNGSKHKREWHVKELKSDRYFDPVH